MNNFETLKIFQNIVAFCTELTQSLMCLLRVLIQSDKFKLDFGCCNKASYILGTGPSLRIDLIALNKLDRSKYNIYAVNEFYKTDDFFILKPENYVLVDPDYWNDKQYENLSLPLSQFIRTVSWPLNVWLPTEARRSRLVKVLSGYDLLTVKFFNNVPLSGSKLMCFVLFRMKLALPRCQNVLVAAISIAIWNGSKLVNLVGADHDWHKDIALSSNNVLLTKCNHVYGMADNFRPFYKPAQFGTNAAVETFRISEIFFAWMHVHKSYELLEFLSSKMGVKILNCGSNSFIDAFERNVAEK